jgi:folate-binding protein YgfZ
LLSDYKAALEGVAFFDLRDNGKFEVAGPDACAFLNNLCTQDVKNLPVGAGCEAFLTTAKARVIAHVWITHREVNTLWLDMVAGQAEKVVKHLDHYLISEKVELADRTQNYGMLRLVGPKTADLLTTLAIKPSRRHRLLALDGADLFFPIGEFASLRQRLVEEGAVAASSATYQILRVEAGLPEYGIDIDENRLATEVGRSAEAICYTKGCYLGQETIVMTRDRGQANRLLMGVNIAGGKPLAAGTKLFRGAEDVGQVTSSVLSPRLGQVVALAYLRRGSWDPGTQLAVDPATAGGTAVVCSLPFCSGG